MKRTTAALLTLIAIAALAVAAAVFFDRRQTETLAEAPKEQGDFHFALMGDVPYLPEQEPRLEALIAEINADSEVAFTIHDGDIKGGGQVCDDAVYVREAERFSTFENALIYTPGDNEWTDCHRRSNGGFDPLERLALLRRTFYSEPSRSLGRRPLELEFQSAAYPENARWAFGGVMFATVHVVGSNNNRPSSSTRSGNEAEFQARNAAGVEWIRSTFDQAKALGSAGVMLVMQANIIEADVFEPSGFDALVTALRTEIEDFGKPVVLVHGDTHFFRVDEPLLGRPPRLENLTRVETFGHPDVNWVRATIDLDDEEVFSFQPRYPDASTPAPTSSSAGVPAATGAEVTTSSWTSSHPSLVRL